MEQMVPIDGVLCSACGEKLFHAQTPASAQQSFDEAPLCAICRRAAPRFKRAVAYGSYAAELRDLIHTFQVSAGKVSGATSGADAESGHQRRSICLPTSW